ncbi:RES family NAD+ phosphorylase [Bacillus albus]|uniref:RES family NAD+ phosphorylase n=1 Tax=Bacillus albus TaxID=2026189 RepID=UPI002E36D4DC|nr:RES family NAD+ phosphorylase [Bacillus albus]
MNYFICSNCVIDEILIDYINENGSLNECSLCKGNKHSIDLRVDEKFSQMIKGLIRFHYEGIYYSSRFGEQTAEGLLLDDNKIIKISEEFREEYDEMGESEFVNLLLKGGYYEHYENGVSLATGERYDMGPPVPELWDKNLRSLMNTLKYRNYYEVVKQLTDKLRSIKDYIGYYLKEEEFYRARIGVAKECTYSPVDDDILDEGEYFKTYLPYRGKSIGSPPPQKCNEGRMNRNGVSFLYLASDIETAISENRPSRKHLISIGRFKRKSELYVANFNDINYKDFCISDKLIDDYIFLKDIEKSFSIPKPNKDYRETQCFAEAMLNLGFEGIAYKSSLTNSDGYNLVIFTPDKFEYDINFSQVYEVEKVQYKYEEKTSTIKADSWYFCEHERGYSELEGKEIIEKYGDVLITHDGKIPQI